MRWLSCFFSYPSPCGDYGSYHVNAYDDYFDWLEWFPSPCGDYVSYQQGMFRTYRRAGSFRPLAGIMVLICCPCLGWPIRSKGSFRPLAGIMVLIEVYSTLVHEMCHLWFPSPCGDYGSYRMPEVSYLPWSGSFPSPCGDYGSYLSEIKKSILKNGWKGFRPLAGIMVLIGIRNMTMKRL